MNDREAVIELAKRVDECVVALTNELSPTIRTGAREPVPMAIAKLQLLIHLLTDDGGDQTSPTTILPMDRPMADDISALIRHRQERFDEDLDTSIKVVLFNYGDGLRIAHCIRGDWSGTKNELDQTESGLPVCPRCGSGCTEDADQPQLALIHPHPRNENYAGNQETHSDQEKR